RAPPVNLDAMIAASMKDIPSDEELSGDENDPDLLEELSALKEDETEETGNENSSPTPTPAPMKTGTSLVALLEERLKMYQEAEKNAKSAGEISRARRFGRGIKTINDQLKQARAGRVVTEEDIPPPVVTTSGKKPPETQLTPPEEETPTPIDSPEPVAPPVPLRPAPPPPVPVRPSPPQQSQDNSKEINMLKERQIEYKKAALEAKRAGDSEKAISFIRIAKQFDPVIEALLEGKPVDLSAMPPPPSETVGKKEDSEKQHASDANPAVPEENTTEAATSEEGEVDIYSAPPAPTTVMEALEQRLNKYRSTEQAARDEGNSSKARRMGRIVKQYENAIKLHKAGKPIPVDELPTPPGFGPIPVPGTSVVAPPDPSSEDTAPPTAVSAVPAPIPSPRPKVAPPPPSPAIPESSTSSPTQKINVFESRMSLIFNRHYDYRIFFIKSIPDGNVIDGDSNENLRLFRRKNEKDIRVSSNSGLPVDMDTLPVPPSTKTILESDFDFVTVDDCIPGRGRVQFSSRTQDPTLRQFLMCLTTRDHFKAIGDVASANRFEQLAVHSKKDLDAVRCAHKRSEPIPKFHYEARSFSIVQCCTDLGDNDLELTIVQGINYTVPNPKDVDTYVKFEFPYPSEDPPKDRTSLVKDTNNPEYNAIFNLTIHRNVRACQRVFKRHSIKLEVWSRGGFFRSDSLIGTVNVKLLPLETKCIIHDSFD
ncbi:hypothetical protein L9F63_015812, partial [Diploptera punctata]